MERAGNATAFVPADQLGIFVREEPREEQSVHKYDLTGPNNVDF